MKDEFEGFVPPPNTIGDFKIVANRDNDEGGADFIIEGSKDTMNYLMNEGFVFMLIKGIFGFTTNTLMDFLEETRGIQKLTVTDREQSVDSTENDTKV